MALVLVDTVAQGSGSFTAVDFGAEDATRELIAVIGYSQSGISSMGHPTAVTIGGIAATRDDNGGTGNFDTWCSVWRAAVPTGTSGNISVTINAGSANRWTLSLWSLTNRDTGQPVPYDRAFNRNSTGTDSGTTLQCDVPSGGAAISAFHRRSTAVTTGWTGITEEYSISPGTLSLGAGGHHTDSTGGEVNRNFSWTSAGGSGTQKTFLVVSYAMTGDPINKTLTIDYEIELPEVEKSLTINWAIGIFTKSLTLDYNIAQPVDKTLTIDWTYQFTKPLTIRYQIDNETDSYFDQQHVLGGDGGLTSSAPLNSTGSEIDDPEEFSLPSALVIPEPVILGNVTGTFQHHFYGDFYFRIWLDPSLRRLNNPRLNVLIPFNIWSAYPYENELVEVLATDLTGVELDFEVPMPFDPYEYKTLNFFITSDAPTRLDGTFDFIFDHGQGTLHIIATIVEIMRSILPNDPLIEVWSWKTVVSQAWAGNEQRSAYRDEPRVRIEMTGHLDDEQERLIAYRQLYTFIARDLRFPFFQYMVQLDAAASEGDSVLLFDPDATDLRDEDFAALWNPRSEQLQIVKIATVDANGATLDNPLDFDVGAGWSIMPAHNMRIPDNSALGMRAIEGNITLRAESVNYRTLERPGSTGSLIEYDGLPVLDVRPIAVADITEAFDGGVEVIDNDSSLPLLYTSWGTPFIGAPFEFKIDRPDDMDFWRMFGKYCQGMQKPFLMPTWREDLPLTAEPTLGSSTLLTSNEDYVTQWEFDTYKRIQIETQNGIVYRTVVSVTDLGTGVLSLALDSGLGALEGDNVIRRVSFLNVARLASDEIRLAHSINHTVVGLAVRTINE